MNRPVLSITSPEVPTTGGVVRGTPMPEGAVFRGIPYAAPPVGALRFLPPRPAERWDGIRDCTMFGPDCPQLRPGRIAPLTTAFNSRQPMDEDCLTLNVWTPAADDAGRPTMVWLHGGAFIGGSGAASVYDGSRFARDGMVLVTLNYRLHALGLLYLDELFDGPESTANVGILDQVAALGWVRDNIARFGGDPANVTVFGESAGAVSTCALLGMPAADGLYRRAIVQSGSADHTLPPTTATAVARRVLDLVKVRPGDWDALRAVRARRLARVASRVFARAAGVLGEDRAMLIPFLPVGDSRTLPAAPIDRVRSGGRSTIDLIVGTNADEYRAFEFGLPWLLAVLMPHLDLDRFFADRGEAGGGWRDSYPTGPSIRSRRDRYAAVITDHSFTLPAIRLAEAHAAAGGRTWMYRFAWPTPAKRGKLRAAHALEIPFVFDTLDRGGRLWGAVPPRSLATAMHDAWSRFARDGDPDGGWPRYEAPHRDVMAFGDTVHTASDPHRDLRTRWLPAPT